MAGGVMESIVILDDDDEEACISASTSYSNATNCQLKTPVKKQLPSPTHITQSPFASAKKDVHVLKVENEKLFAEFVDHCSKYSQDHPEVMTYLQTRYSKALPTFLTSVEFRNTIGRCLTRAQANTGKTFVYINELCTVLKQHTARKRSSIQSVPSQTKPEHTSNGTGVNEEAQVKEKEEKQEADEETKKPKRASRRQIAYLENLLKVYNEEIRRLQERELSIDDLEKEDSSYIQEHKLKRKMMKIYEKLCELKDCDTLTGRVIEQKISYGGTRYPEINKKIERYINSPEALHNPPDYTDILKVVQRANERYKLMLARKQIIQIAQDAFRETGNKLQERRHLDMVYNFGSHLTDSFKPTLDPALTDPALTRKLRSNRDMALSSLEEVITRYATKQEDIEVEEMRKRQERDRLKKEALNGQQSDGKEKEKEKEEEQEEKQEEEEVEEEEEEDEEEEDDSSDPDIEEEIQASREQAGPDDDEEDAEEEHLNNSDNDQPIDENSPLSIKSSVQDTKEDPGDDDQRSPASSTHETGPETDTDGRPAKQSPPFTETLDPMPTDETEPISWSDIKSTTSCTETISTNQHTPSTPVRSATCSPLPQTSPLLIDEMGNYKKRKRSSPGKQTAAFNGTCTRDRDIPLNMGVICCPEEEDLTRTRSSAQVTGRSSRDTPPPKKNKVNVATQCDPEEVIVLSDSD
ncbi:death domain-associated protein 6-like [Carassius gibelio]|uniref:death domain-associated protein 6-like n=1 Tax=Carassius gibelio TaxID=101364 RepID=UPI002277FAF6|nr:death domain-associated protein 6-like [Carassius gibelio]XP_052441279.1 death domain-associated protein 6-like [Carassius gibelio]XP_052441280.1 death domain-associated protein 6-like [Carassius gibelio]XP_052441281.1 death domain-associated protein 6-like [Carassius gibelio]XP_052441282.1 death domain-associated protein 6-like [Carassius gibelio]